MPVVAAVGAVFSIYEGVQQEKAAKAREQRGDAMESASLAATGKDKEWYDQNIRPLLGKLVGEAESPQMSAAGVQAQDTFLKGIGQVQRQIDTQAGQGFGGDSGLTTSKNEVLGLERAAGLGRIRLQDTISKKQLGITGAQIAGQGSQAAALQQGAFQGAMGREDQEQVMHQKQADSAWQSAAKGMSGLADWYTNPEAAIDFWGNQKPAPAGTT